MLLSVAGQAIYEVGQGLNLLSQDCTASRYRSGLLVHRKVPARVENHQPAVRHVPDNRQVVGHRRDPILPTDNRQRRRGDFLQMRCQVQPANTLGRLGRRVRGSPAAAPSRGLPPTVETARHPGGENGEKFIL